VSAPGRTVPTMKPKRVMIDSNVYDEIVAVPGLTSTLRRLIHEGDLELVVCHVQEDEIQRTPDPAWRETLESVPVSREVPSAVFVLGWSRLGRARLGGEQQGDLSYEGLAGPNRRNVGDALIALTAANEADALVTQEHRLQSQLASKPLPVWTFDDFHKWVVSTDGHHG